MRWLPSDSDRQPAIHRSPPGPQFPRPIRGRPSRPEKAKKSSFCRGLHSVTCIAKETLRTHKGTPTKSAARENREYPGGISVPLQADADATQWPQSLESDEETGKYP